MGDNNYIDEEDLKNIAPNLYKIGKQNPFAVPEGYFDALPSEIEALIHTEQALSQINNGNAFDVPPGYFDELPFIIQNKVQQEKKPSYAGIVIEFIASKKYAIAAILVIAIAVVSYDLFITTNVDKKELASSETSVSFEEAASGLDESVLMEEYVSSQAADNSKEIKSDANEDEIVNYLFDNDKELSTIISEL
jgi:hypothetical protein